MAKVISLINLNGTIGDYTFVKKKTPEAVTRNSEVIKRNEKNCTAQYTTPHSARSEEFGCGRGKVDDPITTKGMRMVGAGEV